MNETKGELYVIIERDEDGYYVGEVPSTIKGNRAISRYEFAAGLNAAGDRINELIAAGLAEQIAREDVVVLQRLQEEFAVELATLRGRVDALEVRTAELEANQFSTTTVLKGLLVLAINQGGFASDRILSATGAEITTDDPNATILYRSSLNFNTSFTGTDLLRILLDFASNGPLSQAEVYVRGDRQIFEASQTYFGEMKHAPSTF